MRLFGAAFIRPHPLFIATATAKAHFTLCTQIGFSMDCALICHAWLDTPVSLFLIPLKLNVLIHKALFKH